MIKIKVSEATNKQLDWLVAKCENKSVQFINLAYSGKVLVCSKAMDIGLGNSYYDPSSNWELAGPIIEREEISLNKSSNYWVADASGKRQNWELYKQTGSTFLIAAMRCFVLSKLGNDVEVPDELT